MGRKNSKKDRSPENGALVLISRIKDLILMETKISDAEESLKHSSSGVTGEKKTSPSRAMPLTLRPHKTAILEDPASTAPLRQV